MKFYSDAKNLVVWDSAKGRELCVFNGGELECENDYICLKLADLGYAFTGLLPKEKIEPPADIHPSGEIDADPNLGGGSDGSNLSCETVSKQIHKELTLEELKAKAAELGIKFSHNTGAVKLKEKIDSFLAENKEGDSEE